MHWLWAPVGLLLLLPLPTLAGSLLLPAAAFPKMFGQPLFLTPGQRLLAIAYFASLIVLGAVVVPMSSRARASISLNKAGQRWLDRSVRGTAWLTFASYAVWFGIALSHGLNLNIVSALLRGDPGTMYVLRHQYFETAGGVTTWMQVGAVCAPLAILRSRAGIRRARTLLLLLFVLSFVRALLDSERLAVLEVVVSATMAYLLLRKDAPRTLRGTRVILVFIAGWAALLVVFGAFEYFRSWNTQGVGSSSFWAFAGTLLFGYYATALNLAAFDSSMLHGHTWFGYLFNGDIYRSIFGDPPTAGVQAAYGLQTYTNRSGLLVPANAAGIFGGLLVVLALGFAITICARRAARGHPVALVAYCGSAVGVLELVRIFYYGDSRFLPVVIVLIILEIDWALMRHRSEALVSKSKRR
jgi:hypothetical protein